MVRVVHGGIAMNYHKRASEESRRMCEALEQLLARKIANLVRSESEQWCSLNEVGRSKFAYINHRRRMHRIEIWCMGDPENLQRHTKLKVQKTLPTTGGFGDRYQARVFVDSPSYIEDVANMLMLVAYPMS